MERVNTPYVLMDTFLQTVRLLHHYTYCCIHNVLTTIRMHLHRNDIMHGDLHFGNIFVDDRFVGFEQPTTPVIFIDFGRTINLRDKFPPAVIHRILSIDVLLLVRAACRECFMQSSLAHDVHNQAIIILKASYYYYYYYY
jgi:predicted unusual protein kinase regulating ubiquinone biosynthesis (AarF/ABC1/UbiB family)